MAVRLRKVDQPNGLLTDIPFLRVRWSPIHSYALLSVVTILCFVPFSARAFHVDDTLFIRVAQNIAKHPLDPYGFQIAWDWAPQSMSEVTQNPPLASYYAALAGSAFGWSEPALHLSFLPVTLLLILGTYRLASRFTRLPLLAALAALLSPGLLVSACSVMCDTMMLTLWVWASILWIDGFDRNSHYLLAAAAFLIAASALTKYFGISLLPLLLIYSLWRRPRPGIWACHLLFPVAVLIAYQLLTERLYGHGLLLGAAQFASTQRGRGEASLTAMAIMDLSFTGGCALSTLVFAPLLWPRAMLRNIALGSLLATLLIALGWLNLGLQVGGSYARRENWLLVDTQLALCIAGGISMLALAIVDYRDRRDAASAFLALWVLGTFAFAAFINYTVNARSVLPLIPAAGILIARRIEETCVAHLRNKIAVALVLCAAVSLVVASADASLANSARRAARLIIEKTHARVGALWFEGHWGFQYYMEQAGAEALNLRQPQLRPGDILALPSNNIQTRGINPKLIASREQLELDLSGWAATIDGKHRAGFYSAYWGPLPYIIVRPPVERYEILQIADHARLK
jgi:4-amino-4-deoxy-L-arabinose transferase-like glycosyltransferase